MSTNNQYNFTEADLGPNFAEENMKNFKELINAALSFVVLSMPGVGVSYFLKYLAMQDFAHFVHVDLYSLPSLTQHEFYKETLKAMLERSFFSSSAYKLLLTNLESMTDEQLFLETKKTLQEISRKRDKIVIIFSRFDQLKKEFDWNFLSNIQSLTTVVPNKITLIFTSTKPLSEIIESEALAGGNLNFYSEELYFKPFSSEDLQKLLKIEPARPTSSETLEKLLDLSGGHNQLFRILLSSQKQQNLLLDRFVKMQLQEFIDYLDYHQRKMIQKIALGKTVNEVDEYLLGIGMISSKGRPASGWELFTPLLSEYIKTNMPVKLPVKEAKLFKLLRKNIGNTVSKDEIFKEVWPDNEGASDWALDALIYRLRKHPFMQSHGYIIESQKKQGYTLVQT